MGSSVESNSDEPLASDLMDDPAVAQVRLELMAQALAEPLQLGGFTDEELVALDDPTADPIFPSPWFDSLDAAAREIAVTSALRFLTARGFYQATPVDAATGEVAIEVDGDIGALLTMRRFSLTLLIIERTGDLGTDYAVAFAQPQSLWLTELIDRAGFHDFRLALVDPTVEQIVEFCAPVVPAEASKPIDFTLSKQAIADDPECLSPLEGVVTSVSLTRVTIISETQILEHHLGVFAGPDLLVLSEPAGDDPECLHYRSCDAAELSQIVRDHLVETVR